MSENTTTVESTTAAAAPAEEKKDFIKASDWNAGKDWSYLADKAPDDSHILKAEMMNRFGPEGFEITPDQVKVFLAMHRWVQQSDANQSREAFRGRTWESVEKGYQTLAERAAKEIEENGPNAKMVPLPNLTGLTAADLIPETPAEEASAPLRLNEQELADAAEAEAVGTEEAKAEPEAKPEPKKAPQRRARAPRGRANASIKVGKDEAASA